MKIVLTNTEAEEIFYNSLCNGLSEMCSSYDLEDFSYDVTQYQKAKGKLLENPTDTVCFEDVLLQLLRDGGKLTLIDPNDDMSYSIELNDIHKRVKKTPITHLINYVTENDDYYTANAVLQTVFIGKIIYE